MLRNWLTKGRHVSPAAVARFREMPWESPLRQIRYVVFDLETTGLRPWEGDEIIEIGAVAFEKGQKGKVFQSLVNPGREIPEVVSRLTGLSRAELEGAPSPADVVSRFLEWAGRESVLIAHGAPFDLAFLARHRRSGGTGSEKPVLDTVQLGRVLRPGVGPSLDQLAAAYGVYPANRHRALGDAQTTARVFQAMLRELERSGITTLTGIYELLAAHTSAYPTAGSH